MPAGTQQSIEMKGLRLGRHMCREHGKSRPEGQHVRDPVRSPASPEQAPAMPASQPAADRSTSPFAQLPKSLASPTGVLLLTKFTVNSWELAP